MIAVYAVTLTISDLSLWSSAVKARFVMCTMASWSTVLGRLAVNTSEALLTINISWALALTVWICTHHNSSILTSLTLNKSEIIATWWNCTSASSIAVHATTDTLTAESWYLSTILTHLPIWSWGTAWRVFTVVTMISIGTHTLTVSNSSLWSSTIQTRLLMSSIDAHIGNFAVNSCVKWGWGSNLCGAHTLTLASDAHWCGSVLAWIPIASNIITCRDLTINTWEYAETVTLTLLSLLIPVACSTILARLPVRTSSTSCYLYVLTVWSKEARCTYTAADT